MKKKRKKKPLNWTKLVLDFLPYAKSIIDKLPNERWPCQECGRRSTDDPLRTKFVWVQDEESYIEGCRTCNMIEVLTETRKRLKRLEKLHPILFRLR